MTSTTYRILRCTRFSGRGGETSEKEHLGSVASWRNVALVAKEVTNDISVFERRRGAVRLLGNGKAKPLSTREDVSCAALHALPRPQALNTSKCSVEVTWKRESEALKYW